MCVSVRNGGVLEVAQSGVPVEVRSRAYAMFAGLCAA